ncbi:MAG: ComF family protein [Eubacteriales bacterium]|jgi:ComF family protein|nr:ComF family protein [Eubacteriales bacterium]MDD4104592.1 ComF family protein [Eubacteriales bacterium]MDD4710051.1 ComF family protein [Eubacteriales bacterium]NLO15818.1 ComF family protein [Clostridiales bacterium]
MTFATFVARVLLPKAMCLSCGEPRRIDVDDELCDMCVAALEELKLSKNVCPHCLSPRLNQAPCAYCLKGGMRYLAVAYAPFHYHGVVQHLVARLKFGRIDDAARPLAAGMAECIAGIHFDALVPVPLHARRLAERGINQAEWLCRLLSQRNGLPVVNALKRTRSTRRQSSLHQPEKRLQNVEDAFEALLPVRDMHLLLVDDVRTTGATARACAHALMKAGAADVSLLTAAIAPPRKSKMLGA